MKIQQALELYLDFLKNKGCSPRSLYTYGKDAQQIALFFRDCELEQVTKPRVGKFLKSDVLLWVADKKPRSARTVKKTLYFFRRFLTWSLEQGWLCEVPLPTQLFANIPGAPLELALSDRPNAEENTG